MFLLLAELLLYKRAVLLGFGFYHLAESQNKVVGNRFEWNFGSGKDR